MTVAYPGFRFYAGAGGSVVFAQFTTRASRRDEAWRITVYMFRLAEGIDPPDQIRQKTIKGGETVAVAGKNITMIGSRSGPSDDSTSMAIISPTRTSILSLSAEQKSKYAIISVKIPEGPP